METTTIKYTVLESATGEELGALYTASDSTDEQLVQSLVDCGFLELHADAYMIDDAYLLTDAGERVVVTADRHEPVITLAPPPAPAPQEPAP